LNAAFADLELLRPSPLKRPYIACAGYQQEHVQHALEFGALRRHETRRALSILLETCRDFSTYDQNLLGRRVFRETARDFMNSRAKLCIIQCIALDRMDFN